MRWPHDQSNLTSAPVVTACCLLVGAVAALTPGLRTDQRFVAALGAPAFLFTFGWFTVSLILRILGRLRPLSLARAVTIGMFYLGFVAVVIGLAMVVGRNLGLGSVPSEQMALDALQVAGSLGTMVAAKQALNRLASEGIGEGRR